MAESIELPKDAEGREIPLDTMTLYDKEGKDVHVLRWVFLPLADKGLRWRVESSEFPHGKMPENFHLTTPDSRERLETDIESLSHKENVCCYFGHGNVISCDVCPAIDIDKYCLAAVARDILHRAKALVGRGE